MGAAAYRRGSRAISARIDRELEDRRRICGGTYWNGPDKAYARCDRCGRVDYGSHEGDKCTWPPRTRDNPDAYMNWLRDVQRRAGASRTQYHDRDLRGLFVAGESSASAAKRISGESSAALDQRMAQRISERRDNPHRQKFKTQAEIDKTITEYIARGNRAEEQRDRAPFESAAYWKHHDVAVKWFTKAEALMPGGSHWRRDNPHAWSRVFG
jgi:hypothetical protein